MSQNNPVFVDPQTFKTGDFTIILCNDSQGMLGWFIKWYTKGNYCHAMLSRKPGFVCTQNDLFKEVPISLYLKKSEGLKFWRINGLTSDEFKLINDAISSDLALPWWRRMYDYVGLLGQALHLTFIHTPGVYYCSERDSKYLRLIPRISSIIPDQPSPEDLDCIFNANSDLFTCIGYFWMD